MSRHPFRALFESQTSFATPLCVAMIDTFGTEAIEWDMATLALEVRDEFGARMPGAVFERLLTGFLLLSSNSFFNSVPDFARACLVLSGHTVVGFTLPEADDIAWGMTEAMLLTGEDGEEPFTKEIEGFVQAVCQQEGILDPPDVLKIGGPGQIQQIQQDFSDDPSFYSSVWALEKDRQDRITTLISGRLQALMLQLHGLPLSNGSTQHVKKLLSSLPATQPIPLG